MTPIEILILIYGLIGIGVGIGWHFSCLKDTKELYPRWIIIFSIFIGLLWVVSIPARLTEKLFE